MENNTYTVSSYIEANKNVIYDYLCDLKNLDEWTLFSRMKTQVDDKTWIGTASAYQKDLYYHIEKNLCLPFLNMEWHCGFEHGKYFQVYPTYLFEPKYIDQNSHESGSYFHWLSFANPEKRTPMYSSVVNSIHASECRALKNILERKSGLDKPAKGKYAIKTSSIYINAPLHLGVQYLSYYPNMLDWCHFVKPRTKNSEMYGEFYDEYERKIDVSMRVSQGANEIVIEHDTTYLDFGNTIKRAPILLYPCSYVFADKQARGFILQRMSFWDQTNDITIGKMQIEDYHAENISAKRMIELKMNNLTSFELGTSFIK